jgi:hypothetical protein
MQQFPRDSTLAALKMFLMSDLEPFAEKVRRVEGALSPSQYRIGYRCSTTQAVLTQLEIPAEIVERTVLGDLLVVPRITPDGTVTANILTQRDSINYEWLDVVAMPIYELVNRAMTSENLRLEEARLSDLEALRDLLERSVSKVRATIAIAAKTT